MPSIIDQIRQRQAWEEPKKASLWPLILGVFAAFLVGVGGVYSWNTFKTSPQTAAISKAAPAASAPQAAGDQVSFASDAPRVGRPELAPLLKTCVQSSRLGAAAGKMLGPEELYRIVQQGGQMMQIAAATGMKMKPGAQGGFASMWADVADCIYRQNGWMFCDPNNRALAIEAANTFSRQVAAASGDTPGSTDMQYALSNARAVRDRVLSALRARVEEGRLIPSDFGLFPQEDVRKVLGSAKPKQDACASRG
jgi:hypothetical protein